MPVLFSGVYMIEFIVRQSNLQTGRLDSDQHVFCGCCQPLLRATSDWSPHCDFPWAGVFFFKFLCSFDDVNNCSGIFFLLAL